MAIIDRVSVLSEAITRLDGWDPGYPRKNERPSEISRNDAVPVSKGNRQRKDFREIQRIRRSVHQYQEQAISLAEATAVCDAAHDPASNTEIILAARNVEGLEAGVYVYGDGRFALLESVPTDSPRREEWFLQREFATAPAVLIFVSSVAACGDSMHAYRQMMICTGEQCQNAALAAVGVGLGGVIFAGLLMVGLLDLGIDGYHRTGIVGYAFGKPQE